MSNELPPDDWKPETDPDLSYEAPHDPSYGQPAPPLGSSGFAPPPPTPGKAIAALVFGILGLVMCGCFPLGIVAWVLGKQAEREIVAARGALAGEGLAKAGWIIGMVATIGGALYVLVMGALVGFGLWADTMGY